MIVGIGIDVVEIQRMRELIDRWGETFFNKVFTEQERQKASTRADAAHHYAGRFAVKEAVAKALATGWTSGFRWQDVEVTNDDSGKPSVQLFGAIKEMLKENSIFISISHSENVIVAMAIIESAGKK